jgi:putative ABC transport system ATP-binding protein
VTDVPAVVGTGLTRTYVQGPTKIPALRGVDVTVDQGEFLAITGQSGSGKSTLLHLLAGLDRPDAGEVRIQGTLLTGLSEDELSLLRRRRLGIVLQFFNLLPTLTALENVAFPLLLDGAPDATTRAADALDRVNLAHRADHPPSALSGGEQQRVALARTIVNDPAAIFADEPTGSLDSLAAEDLLRLLRQLANGGQTVVLVTHDPLAASFADRVIRLRDGVLVDAVTDGYKKR